MILGAVRLIDDADVIERIDAALNHLDQALAEIRSIAGDIALAASAEYVID